METARREAIPITLAQMDLPPTAPGLPASSSSGMTGAGAGMEANVEKPKESAMADGGVAEKFQETSVDREGEGSVGDGRSGG